MRIALICLSGAPLLLGGCLTDAVLHKEAVQSASLRQVICIDQVEYIAVPVKDAWAMAPHYKPDGTLYTCTDSVPRHPF